MDEVIYEEFKGTVIWNSTLTENFGEARLSRHQYPCSGPAARVTNRREIAAHVDPSQASAWHGGRQPSIPVGQAERYEVKRRNSSAR